MSDTKQKVAAEEDDESFAKMLVKNRPGQLLTDSMQGTFVKIHKKEDPAVCVPLLAPHHDSLYNSQDLAYGDPQPNSGEG